MTDVNSDMKMLPDVPAFTTALVNKRPTAGDLCIPVPSVNVEDTNAMVLEMFGIHRELFSLPVQENGRAIGLISRNIFMSQMSKPYYREVYERKSCIAFMDKDPLIVEAETTIEDLAVRTVQTGDKTLVDGFLIVNAENLLGIGSGLDLMRKMVDLQLEKNRQVMQSIDYASVIQRAMLSTSRESMNTTLKDACLIWQPRDVVGGDFYYFESFSDGWFAAVADCTGHGVPGAFLTVIASSVLTQALQRLGPRDPALLMSNVNKGIKKALGQGSLQDHYADSDDGMDAVFMWMNNDSQTLTYASANMPLFILPSSEADVEIFNGNRVGLGYVTTPSQQSWENNEVTLTSGSIVMTVTDGVIDQIGGEKNISYGKKRLTQALRSQCRLPMLGLAESIIADCHIYQGEHSRRDDVTLFGFRLV